MILIIDTTENDKATIQLITSDKQFQQVTSETKNLIKYLYQAVDKILSDAKSKISDIDAILVNPGPGAYTATRIGVTFANTLAWANDIPILEFDKNNLARIVENIKKSHEKSKFVQPVSPKYPYEI